MSMLQRFNLRLCRGVIRHSNVTENNQLRINTFNLLLRRSRRCFSLTEISVPNLGDSITEGTIAAIHKNVGDTVATDDIVLEIETDKVSVDIRAPIDGYIAKFFASVNDDIQVGASLYSISDAVSDSAAILQTPTPTPTPTQSNVVIEPALTTIALDGHGEGSKHNNILKRMPSIKFRHGSDHYQDLVINGISSILSTAGPGTTLKKQQTQTQSQSTMATLSEMEIIPFWFGAAKRTAWTESEIHAVNSGGATLL